VTLGDVSVGCTLREFEKVRTRTQTTMTGVLWLRLREVVELVDFSLPAAAQDQRGRPLLENPIFWESPLAMDGLPR
jgi:hypothetical protein